MSSVLPKQKVSSSERTLEWKRSNIEYFTFLTDFNTGDRAEMIECYKAASGYITKGSYSYVLNPYNSKDENLKKYPAQMRNYDIISPVVNAFMGEKAGLPNLMQVVCTNADVPNAYTEDLNKQYLGLMAQAFVNRLNETGVQTGVESQEIPPFDRFMQEHKTKWQDNRAILGQEALDYIRYNCDLDDKFQNGFYDWLCTNRVYGYKDINNNDLDYEIVPTLELWHGSSKTGLVEDAAWAVRRSRLTGNEILDRFNKYLTEEDLIYVEERQRQENGATDITGASVTNIDNRNNNRNPGLGIGTDGLFDVFHCVWKTWVKRGFLRYIDEFGMEQELVVDDTYKLNKEKGDIDIEWEWENEVWEGYKIGDRIIEKTIGAIIAQRNEINNSSVCKLPYNGKIDSRPSVVATLIPYQTLINIYHFRRELTMARNKDKIALIPMGLVPEKLGQDKFMYFAEALGYMFIDETKPNAAQIMSSVRNIDLGLGNYIAEMTNLIREIKDEAWDAVGMNRQRYGDVKTSDGKATTEAALQRSAVITREMFRKFSKFEEAEYQGLLDYSKVAWADGKKGMYITSDGYQKMLNIVPETWMEAELGVFAKDNSSEYEKLQQAKQIAFAIAQKGNSPATLALEILDNKNFSKIKELAYKAEDIEKQFQQAQQEAEAANAQALAQQQAQVAQLESQTKLEVAHINAEAVIAAAQIKANQPVTAGAEEGNAEQDIESLLKSQTDAVSKIRRESLDRQKLGLQADKQSTDARLKERELGLKEKDIDNKLKIAKANKNKYDR